MIKWKKLAFAGAVALCAAILGFMGADMFLQPYFREHDWNFWLWFDYIGSWKIWAAVSLAVFAIMKFFRYESRIRELSANVFCSVIFAESAIEILKICIGRMRPVMFDALGRTGFEPFSLSDTYHSFPSGHAAAAFAALVSIGLMYPKSKQYVWTIAVFLGISRVCMGAHWPSDVIFAAFIGMAAADLVVYFKQTAFVKH